MQSYITKGITDMHGRYFAFERDAKGLPVTITDQTGKKTAFAYDAQGHATEITNPDGFKKRFGYSNGMLTSLKNGALAEERYTYDKTGRLLTSESEGGVNRLEHYYNDRSSKTVITDALGAKTVFVYKNEDGRKLTTAVTDALNNTAYLGYDGNYNIAVTTDTLGRATRFERNNNGDPVAITDALGNTSTIQYQVKLNYKDAAGEHTDYYSRPIRITDALGRTTKLDYDSFGNLSKAEDALGNKTSMAYDKAGHMLSMRDAAGATYKYEYNMGLAKTVDPLDRVTKYQRDADLRVTMVTDPLGRNTSFTYDLSGNVTEVRNPADFVTKFAYGDGGCPSCAGGQLSALTDPKGNTWTFNYDQYGRLSKAANPLGQRKAYGYDKLSRVTEVKDPAGNITTYAYDVLNRLTKIDIQTPSGAHAATTYTYDAVGNTLSASNGGSAVEFAYDALNRPVETKQTFAGKPYPVSYTYDVVGNRTSMSTPWGKYSYTYDVLNRAASITNPQGITAAFRYDAAGRRIAKSILTSGVQPLTSTDYTYDAAGQLLEITNKAGGKVVAFNKYTYDKAGNRVRIEDQNGVKKYTYDKSNRLIIAEPVPMSMPEAEAFVYDRNGNRRYDRGAFDYKYDAANRLLENTTYTYTHDLLGNLTSRTEKGGGAAITYAYNPENRLSSAVNPEGIKSEYKYDPLGRRIEKSVDGSPRRYVYDNEDIIAILDVNNNVTETFTHGPSIDEPLIMTRADGSNYFYHADGLGSITALTDAKGETAQTIKYQAYGKPVTVLYDPAAAPNSYYFTAREYDEEAGLYYYRARYYDWRRGAFTQEDPLGLGTRGGNIYSYAGANPMMFVDPFGHEFISLQEGVLLANEAGTWTGTPYQSPGNIKGVGADCSGATSKIYSNVGFYYPNTGSKGIPSTAQLRPAPGPSQAIVKSLSEMLFRDKNYLVRIQAADSLGNIKLRSACPALVGALKDVNPLVRSYAASALGQIKCRAAMPAIQRALNMEHSQVSQLGFYEAQYLLGKKSALKNIILMLNSHDYRIRCATANILGRLANHDSINPISSALKVALEKERTGAAKSSLESSLSFIGSLDKKTL